MDSDHNDEVNARWTEGGEQRGSRRRGAGTGESSVQGTFRSPRERAALARPAFPLDLSV